MIEVVCRIFGSPASAPPRGFAVAGVGRVLRGGDPIAAIRFAL